MNRAMTTASLTEDMIKQISQAVEMVSASQGFGEVIIVIQKGVPRWVKPSPSIPLAPAIPPDQRQT